MLSAFWVDSERCNDHVRFSVDHFTDHTVPLLAVTTISLQKGQTSVLNVGCCATSDVEMCLCMVCVNKI